MERRTTLWRVSLLSLIVVSGCGPPPRPQLPEVPLRGPTQGYVLIDRPDGTGCAIGSTLQLRAQKWEHGEWSAAVVSWKSDKTSVAMVNSSGLVTCKSSGRALITAVSPEGWRDHAVVEVAPPGVPK